MKKKYVLFCLLICTILIFTGCKNKNNGKLEINISVASSLKDAMREIKSEYEKINNDVELVINYGGSGSLKQQILQGAPCDLFISASIDEIDVLNKRGNIEPNSIKNLLTNQLVAIVPSNSNIDKLDDIIKDSVKTIGVGYPESVPVGKYTYEMLESTSLKNHVENKLVYAKDVKEVLSWVQLENVDVGFVYLTDTIKNNKVKIVEKIDSTKHSKIIYPMAIIKQSKNIEEVIEIQEFLLNETSKDIFEKYGYEQCI